MRSRKTVSGLNTSPSEINRKLKCLKPPGYDLDIGELLLLAEEKMHPIIRMLVECPNSTSHFVSIKECYALDEISNIVTDVVKALQSIGFQMKADKIDLDMEKYRGSANSQGYIYVDTTLLLGILELYNILEGIKEDICAFYRSIGVHSFVQTESGVVSLCSSNGTNPNKILFKFEKPSGRGSASFARLQNEFIVMPSSAEVVPLTDSKSQILNGSLRRSMTKRSKSASSVENEEISGVTDVYGARKVLVKCIYDLQEVSNYLGTPRKDASTIISRAEVDTGPTRSSRGSKTLGYADDGERPESPASQSDSQQKCCCSECFAHADADGSDLKECEDDQVIICIKGCNEDEGDVQIVIRQCPDCKKAASNSKQLIKSEEDRSRSPEQPNQSRPSPPTPQPESDESKQSVNPTREIESTILHNKDSAGSVVCSDEEDEEKKLIESTYVQNRASCSRIKLYETTNLCLQTETGQELVISLTVTPKDLAGGTGKLSLRDIFSDADYDQTKDIQDSSYTSSDHSIRTANTSKTSKKKRVSSQPRDTYFVSDRYIPLGRTKLCSSLDFDVTNEESKIRQKGIQNKNNKILVQLQDFGTDNLLRACRPAKCCRKAILNEKMKKCLPYAPSIRSLPLDDDDLDIINQSLQMSVQKVKNSTNLNKEFYSNQVAYHMEPVPTYTVMYFFIEEAASGKDLGVIHQNNFVRQKLSYYIYLVDDTQQSPNFEYDVMYFVVESKFNKTQSNRGMKKTYSVINEKYQENQKKIVNAQMADVMPTTSVKIFNKIGHNYEERPALTGLGPAFENDLFKTFKSNARSSFEKPKIFSQNEPIDIKKKPFVSKIPVYFGHRALLSGAYRVNEESKLSFSSLAHKSGSSDKSLFDSPIDLSSQKSSDKEDNDSEHLPKIIESGDKFRNFSKQIKSSKCSIGPTLRRGKRKKAEFYVSRSRSEISLNNFKHKNLTNILQMTKGRIKRNISEETSSKDTNEIISQTSNMRINEDASKVVLNYFTKLLYQMIMSQMFKGQSSRKVGKSTSYQINVSVGKEKSSLQELYKKQPYRNVAPLQNTNNFDIQISHIDLKSNHSQHNLQLNKSIYIFKNLALQTSTIILDSKTCQTSSTVLSYLLNPANQMEPCNFKKELIFKKLYNVQNSCDEVENFVVRYNNSDPSIGSRDSERDVESSNSACSGQLIDVDRDETLSQSLLKLKQTLEQYETIKTEIAQGSDINPIEYFVYQMCACNDKIQKKPSVMQKIMDKTKGLFSSVEKDVCRKFRNQRDFLNMPKAEREKLCYNCGCYISHCGDSNNTTVLQGTKPPSKTMLICNCPQDNKPKKQKSTHEPCCIKNKTKTKTPYNHVCRIASASCKTLKRTVNSLTNNKKDPSLGPCVCDKPNNEEPSKIQKKNGDTIVCIGPNVTAVKCEKISAATETTKDSSTQKCECGKCKNFADDGTCCCSHCLGCLDKTCDAKPNSNAVGVETEIIINNTNGVKNKGDAENILSTEGNNSKRVSTKSEPEANTLSTKANNLGSKEVEPEANNSRQSDTNNIMRNNNNEVEFINTRNEPPSDTNNITISSVSSNNNRTDNPSTIRINSGRKTVESQSSQGSGSSKIRDAKSDSVTKSNVIEKNQSSVHTLVHSLDVDAANTPDIEGKSAPSQIEVKPNEDELNHRNSEDIEKSADVETIDINSAETSSNNTANDTTTYFFMTQPPHMFQQFGFSNINPFEQGLFHFAPMNMFHADNNSNNVSDQ